MIYWDSERTFLVFVHWLYDFHIEWWQSQLCQAEVHLSPRYSDDGDAEQQAIEDVGKANPNAAHEEPQHIHEHAQAARLRLFPFHFRAERPDGQHAQLHTLQTERDADDGYHQNQSCDEILNGSMQPAKDQPDDIS